MGKQSNAKNLANFVSDYLDQANESEKKTILSFLNDEIRKHEIHVGTGSPLRILFNDDTRITSHLEALAA